MLVRVLSGLGIGVVMVLLFVLNLFVPYVMQTFASLLILIGIYEALKTAGLEKKYQILIPCELFALSVPWLIMGEYMAAAALIYVIIMFAVMLFSYDSVKFSEISYAVLTSLMIGFGLGSLAGLSVHADFVNGSADYSGKLTNLFVFTAMTIPWGADIGGYFAGVLFGKHKLCPRVSPKKTVEGFAGSIILGTLLPVLFSAIFVKASSLGVDYAVNYPVLTVIALCSVLVSVLGDLTFSIIKRNYGIKDYGNLIPGHGGILDRFDSVIFVAPVMLMCLQYIPVIAVKAAVL